MKTILIPLAVLALLSGCVNVHVHFPPAADAAQPAAPATETTPSQ